MLNRIMVGFKNKLVYAKMIEDFLIKKIIEIELKLRHIKIYLNCCIHIIMNILRI